MLSSAVWREVVLWYGVLCRILLCCVGREASAPRTRRGQTQNNNRTPRTPHASRDAGAARRGINPLMVLVVVALVTVLVVLIVLVVLVWDGQPTSL